MNIPLPSWNLVSDHPNEFCDGDEYLVALQVSNSQTKKTRWEFYKLRVFADEIMQLYYADDVEICGKRCAFSEWSFDDFEYYIKLEK